MPLRTSLCSFKHDRLPPAVTLLVLFGHSFHFPVLSDAALGEPTVGTEQWAMLAHETDWERFLPVSVKLHRHQSTPSTPKLTDRLVKLGENCYERGGRRLEDDLVAVKKVKTTITDLL